jgi:hypothetical protein
MHTIHYTKHFLTGNLAGLAVPCELSCLNAELAQITLESLARLTVETPGSDCVTEAKFWVSFD